MTVMKPSFLFLIFTASVLFPAGCSSDVETQLAKEVVLLKAELAIKKTEIEDLENKLGNTKSKIDKAEKTLMDSFCEAY